MREKASPAEISEPLIGIGLRLPSRYIRRLDDLSTEWRIPKVAVIRKLLDRGLSIDRQDDMMTKLRFIVDEVQSLRSDLTFATEFMDQLAHLLLVSTTMQNSELSSDKEQLSKVTKEMWNRTLSARERAVTRTLQKSQRKSGAIQNGKE